MDWPASWRSLPDDALEELFLNRIADYAACFGPMLDALGHFHSRGCASRAVACADLLQEMLMKAGDADRLVLLLERRAAFAPVPGEFAGACRAALAEVFGSSALMAAYLDACGLSGPVPPAEALRRLRLLRALAPGKCCYEKTWGLGEVRAIDEFDRKVEIDFERKRAQRLAFHYAAETLRLLDGNSLFALKLRDRPALEKRLRSDPAGAVLELLGEFGPMSVTQLRTLATSVFIDPGDWNEFWSQARPKLASDPRVRLPTGRNDPITPVRPEAGTESDCLAAFIALTDVERILVEAEELSSRCKAGALSAAFKDALADRLAFAAKGAPDTGGIVRALLCADAAGIDPVVDFQRYGQGPVLAEALNALTARLSRAFLVFLDKHGIAVCDALLPHMAELTAVALGEVMGFCRQTGAEERSLETIRAALLAGEAGAETIAWVARNLDQVCRDARCGPEAIFRAATDTLAKSLAAGRKREANLVVRQVFANESALARLLSPMSAETRREAVARLARLASLGASERNSVAAKVVRLYPALADLFGAPAARAPQARLTSFRSRRERAEQLERIINVEIPKNSKDIGVARSYGDLRENFEYKSARETQALLMRRKAELEQMLSEVGGTDFAGSAHDSAGPGTGVDLRMPDGTAKTYYILGEWDSDEKLGIISCRSRLAEAIVGRRAGEQVEIPGESAPVRCTVVAVRPLPAEIKAWINA